MVGTVGNLEPLYTAGRISNRAAVSKNSLTIPQNVKELL